LLLQKRVELSLVVHEIHSLRKKTQIQLILAECKSGNKNPNNLTVKIRAIYEFLSSIQNSTANITLTAGANLKAQLSNLSHCLYLLDCIR
jgi:hypothetical protein